MSSKCSESYSWLSLIPNNAPHINQQGPNHTRYMQPHYRTIHVDAF
jgi:hypothetical protein